MTVPSGSSIFQYPPNFPNGAVNEAWLAWFAQVDTNLRIFPAPSTGFALGWDAGGNLVNVPNTGADQTALFADTTLAVNGAGRVGFNPALTYSANTIGSAVALRIVATDLADTAAGSKGAGLVGFSNALTYAAGTVGKFLRDLSSSIGATLISYLAPFTGAVATTQKQVNDERVSVFRFMTPAQIADVTSGALTLDVHDAVVAAIAACKRLYFPAGKYRFNSPLVITNVNGLVLEGAGAALMSAGVTYADNTVLNFDNAGVGADGLTVSTFVGLSIKNFVISHNHAGGGKALYLNTGHDFVLENMKIDSQTGTTGKGFVLGGGTGATAAFLGEVRNCKVISQGGVSFESNATNTSLSFISCYQIGGKYSLNSTVYSTFTSCATESSPDFGWVISGCDSLTFNSCGGEDNAKGVFKLSTTSINILFNTPYGALNNTSADATIGDLIHMDSSSGVVECVTVINPECLSSNAATAQNIYANAGTGTVDVLGVSANRLPKGIGGDSTWKHALLTITGDGEVVSWTPTLVGWTNTGSPTVVGKYVKKGHLVSFHVIVTPGTNISATLLTSTITGFPFTPAAGVASMVDGNGRSLGTVSVSNVGTIYPQSTGVLTVPVTIFGQFIV